MTASFGIIRPNQKIQTIRQIPAKLSLCAAPRNFPKVLLAIAAFVVSIY